MIHVYVTKDEQHFREMKRPSGEKSSEEAQVTKTTRHGKYWTQGFSAVEGGGKQGAGLILPCIHQLLNFHYLRVAINIAFSGFGHALNKNSKDGNQD